MRFILAVLLLLATCLACNATVTGVTVGSVPNCPDGVAPAQAEVYAGEDFYICGNVALNSEPLMFGTIRGSEASAMGAEAEVINSRFSLHGTADVIEHRYHYFVLALEKPCKVVLAEVPVEIRTSCMMVPPSTIEALPNVVVQGDSFSLMVKNAPKDLTMTVTGLKMPITALLAKGASWTQTFSSDQCSQLGSCNLRFGFTDSKHPTCSADANLIVSVRAKAAITDQPEGPDTLLFATLMILVVGTVGAIILNRYL